MMVAGDRRWALAKAGEEVMRALLKAAEEHSLTFGERVALLADLLRDEARYAKRATRRRKK